MSRIIARTGVSNHMKQLSEELVKQGHNVIVVSSTNDLNIGTSENVKFIKVELRSKNPISVIKSLKTLNKIIVDNNIDIVHCHHRMAALYMHWYNFFWKIKYVYTLHLAPIPHDFIHRYFTHFGNQAIAISKEVGDFLAGVLKVPNELISYVLNGVDETKLTPVSISEKTELREKYNIPFDNKVITLHSRICDVKNQLAVVEAVNILPKEKIKKLTILISGEKDGSYYESVLDLINKYQLNDVFKFLGWVETRGILGASDALILPSKSEGFPLNCIEAMFMGVPITRSKVGGYEDTKDYVVAFEDITPTTIAKHIKNIIDGTEYDKNLIVRARDFAHNNCTVSAMTKNTVEVYRKVLK